MDAASRRGYPRRIVRGAGTRGGGHGPQVVPVSGAGVAFTAFTAFTSRDDGDQRIVRNRAAVEARLGISRTTWCEQVHGAHVAFVGPEQAGRTLPRADGLVTTLPGTPLAVVVADCVPLLLAGESVVAAVHAGRRGLAAGVVQVAVRAMREAGAGRISAVVGPAIGPCCYEVGADLRDQVAEQIPAAWAVTRAGTPALDLVSGVRAVLAAEDVPDVEVTGGCTAHQPDACFSYRRAGDTARQAGYVWLP